MLNVPFSDRLDGLGLDLMETKRIRDDLVLIYKTVHGLIDIYQNDNLTLIERISRGKKL